MLTKLSLTNFKSWREIRDMRLAPITGLFGSNSSGKTSILQLLLMLKQTVESPDRVQALIFGDEKTPVNLGTFQDIVLGHLLPGEVSWCVGWRIPPGEKALVIGDPADRSKELFRGRDLQFAAEVEGENGRLSVVEM